MYVKTEEGTERLYVVEKVLEDIPGGGTVAAADFPDASEVMKEGAILGKDNSGLFHLVKTAVAAAGGASDAVRIDTNHEFKVGDYISDGHVSLEIATITEGSTYDTITFDSGTMDIYSEGTVFFATGGVDTTGSGTAAEAEVEDTSGDKLKCTIPVTSDPADFNGVTLKIEQAADDNLAVAYDVGVLTISLADSTAANNNVAAIQAAVRALGIVEGLDWSEADFTGTDWDDKQTGATLTSATDTFSGGVNAEIKTPEYSPVGVAINSVDLTKANTGTGICVRGTVREANMPYTPTAEIKAALPLIRFV